MNKNYQSPSLYKYHQGNLAPIYVKGSNQEIQRELVNIYSLLTDLHTQTMMDINRELSSQKTNEVKLKNIDKLIGNLTKKLHQINNEEKEDSSSDSKIGKKLIAKVVDSHIKMIKES